MLTALRVHWHRQAIALRAACENLYRHYRLDTRPARHPPRVRPLSHGDEVVRAAMARDHEDQYHAAIERQVRRYYEASRFVSKEPGP